MFSSRLAKVLAFVGLISASKLDAGIFPEDYELFSNLHQTPVRVIEADTAAADPTDPWVYGPAYKEHRAKLRRKKEDAQEQCRTRISKPPQLNQIVADLGMQPLHQPQPARLSRTEISEHFEVEGRFDQSVSFKEVLNSVGDKDKLLAAILPQSYKLFTEYDSDRLKSYFISDITGIKNNLLDLAQNPAVQNSLNYEYDKIPFDALIEAITRKDRDSAGRYFDQIKESLGNIQDMAQELKDLDIAERIEQAFTIQSKTVAELERLKPYFDQLIHDPMWRNNGFSRDVDVRGHSSAYSSMEFVDGEDRAKIEQAKVFDARAKGNGHLTYFFDDLMTFGVSAAYHLEYILDEIDAFRFSSKGFGFGAGKKRFERGTNDLTASLHLDSNNLDFEKSKSESEELGDTALTHFFIDHKGKTNIFLDLGFESTDSVLEDEIEQTFTQKHDSKVLANLVASRDRGNYAPFVKVQNSETDCGLYLNTRLLTGRTGTDGSHEAYVKIGKKDSAHFMEYLKQMDVARASHFAGRGNVIESLRNRINEELGGLMLRYSQAFGKKEYSILLGKDKLYLEAGRSADDWLRSAFARANLFGVHLSAEFGKSVENCVDTQNYQLSLPLHTDKFSSFFLDIERSVAEEDRPAVNYQIRRMIRF